MNFYYSLGDNTEYPVVRWNPLVPRNVGATVAPQGKYEATSFKEEQQYELSYAMSLLEE